MAGNGTWPEVFPKWLECAWPIVVKKLHNRINDFHIAEDACQEALLAMWRIRDQLSFSSFPPFLGYLQKSAKQCSWRLAKKERRTRPAEAAPPAGLPHPGWHSMVNACLQQLSDEDRRLLESRYRDGMTFSELAKDLRLSEAGARERVRRAKMRARSVFLKAGLVPNTWSFDLAEGVAISPQLQVVRGRTGRGPANGGET